MGNVHRAWIDLFARKESNKQAIRDRGWVPLVYTLLDHEELKQMKNEDAIKHAEEISMLSGHAPNGLEVGNLNLEKGIAGSAIDCIIEHRMREKARNKALIEHETEIIEKNKEVFNNCLKMTAGVAFRAGELNLSNGNILKRVKEQHEARVEKQLASERRKKEENNKLQEKVERVRSKSDNPQLWNVDELKTMVSWFK